METFSSSRAPSVVEIVPVDSHSNNGGESREKSAEENHNPQQLQHLNVQNLLVPVGNTSVIIERQQVVEDKCDDDKAVTLPTHIAVPIGLAQIFVGVSMVICGALALRYQSYLFYYGSGLWAGTVAGIAGILGVTATKEGLKKPGWLCGGRRWQIHIFLAAVMVALSSAIVAAIFSTSGLVRDTQYDYSKDIDDMTPDEETFEKRKSSGIMINAILLLLSLLQILLSFCSLGIALRVICSKALGRGALLSPGSADGSEVTMRDLLGYGPDYEDSKDRLLRWLGHQRRTFSQSRSILTKNIMANSIYSAKVPDNRLYPRFVALHHHQQQQQQQQNPRFIQVQSQPLPFVIPAPISAPIQRNIIVPAGPHSLPAAYHHHHGHPAYPQPLIVPIIPLPVRHPRSITPVSVATSGGERRHMRGRRRRGGYASSAASSIGGRSKRSSYAPEKRSITTEETDNQVVEISEEELNKTYTGLDRAIAEEFISNTMNRPN